MKFDAIVTEPPARAASSAWPKLLAVVPVFALAFYLAGDGPAGQEVLAKPPRLTEVRLTQAANERSKRSLLTEMAPISSASASITPPMAPAPAGLDPTELGLPNAHDNAVELPAPQAEPQLTRLDDRVITVRNGDSLSILFDRNKLKAADWMQLAKLKGEARRLLKLRPGDRLMLGLDEQGHVAALDMRIDDLNTLKIRREDNGRFAQHVVEDKVEHVQRIVRGTIENSLFLSAKKVGLSDALTMELTDIFAWDVDFALDIRSGDSFEVVYQEIHRDGEKIKDGKILAARFTNRGEAMDAVRYTDDAGQAAYYAPDGKPMKKAFLRSPVDFTRISSRFSLGRKHPILNKIRAHKGVDYAAPRGTPVKSAGAGK